MFLKISYGIYLVGFLTLIIWLICNHKKAKNKIGKKNLVLRNILIIYTSIIIGLNFFPLSIFCDVTFNFSQSFTIWIHNMSDLFFKLSPENYIIEYLLIILQFVPITLLLPMVNKRFKLVNSICFSLSIILISDIFSLIDVRLRYPEVTKYDLAYDFLLYVYILAIIGSIIGYTIYFLIHNKVNISIQPRNKALKKDSH